jgi:transposase InsO family protein
MVEKRVVEQPNDSVVTSRDDDLETHTCSILDDMACFDCFQSSDDAVECFVNFPADMPVNPIAYPRIQQLQAQQAPLMALIQHDPVRYSLQPFGQSQIVCYRVPNQHNWRIYVPDALLPDLLKWYHYILNHPGAERLYRSLLLHFYHPQLKPRVEHHVQFCIDCQRFKRAGRGYGEMPPREALFQPFHEVAVDLIGPWAIQVGNESYSISALTIIDTVTTMAELIRIDNKTSQQAMMKFENEWLSRYPRPVRCIYDQGPEFMGAAFQTMLNRWGIEAHPISVRNPQANAVCERMHQTVGNLLRTLLYTNPPHNLQQANDLVDTALATASHALRSTVHSTMGLSPGSIVFHRDMFLDIPFVADLLMLREKRQAMIDYNLRRENNRRRNFDYIVGEYVFETVAMKNMVTQKLTQQTRGPYRIEQVHTNGTLTIRRGPGVVDRLSIRRLRPAFH